MLPVWRTLCLLGLVALVACATRGQRFDPDSVLKIQPEISTQQDVKRWFGQPTSLRSSGNGASEWVYLYEERTTRDTGTLTKIGRSIASILGARVFYPPIDVRYENVSRHELRVVFDREGVVRDYSYERTDLPSKTVY